VPIVKYLATAAVFGVQQSKKRVGRHAALGCTRVARDAACGHVLPFVGYREIDAVD